MSIGTIRGNLFKFGSLSKSVGNSPDILCLHRAAALRARLTGTVGWLRQRGLERSQTTAATKIQIAPAMTTTSPAPITHKKPQGFLPTLANKKHPKPPPNSKVIPQTIVMRGGKSFDGVFLCNVAGGWGKLLIELARISAILALRAPGRQGIWPNAECRRNSTPT